VDPEPAGRSARVGFRVDGLLHPRCRALGIREHELLMGRLKVLADLNIAERRRPQAGAFVTRTPDRGEPVEIRVSFLPTLDGESASMRLFSGTVSPLPLSGLGPSPGTLERVMRLLAHPSGTLLVAGPTGSGKTTTLYALARELLAAHRRVVMVEEPVERRIPGATQVAVNRAEGLDFAEGLRGVLRHDPDVIVVGEIRDAETADISLAAGLSGHLVLASIHAGGPLAALERLVHLGVDRGQLITVLSGILTQRLIRLRCRRCAGEHCFRCGGTGFWGRTGLFGLYGLDSDVRDQILGRHTDLAAGGERLEELVKQGEARVASGETTATELVRVLPGAVVPV
jgi:type II secretory ATPase GspE/PulE/Tfp pilus assembly ATPase PilB-like protein